MHPFTWRVPVSGFKWVEVQQLSPDDLVALVARRDRAYYRIEGRRYSPDEPALLLIEADPSDSYREYHPLNDATGLFRTFAKTKPTQNGILAFADRYGALGAYEFVKVKANVPGAKSEIIVGQSLNLWQNHIQGMREAVTLFDQARQGRADKLHRLISWDKDGAHYRGTWGFLFDDKNLLGPSAAEARNRASGLSAIRPKDYIAAAWFCLQQIVNRYLTELGVQYELTQTENGFQLCEILDGLEMAMWVQLAHAITGHKEYRDCAQCGASFEIAPGVARADRNYCSNACRSAAYRRRKGASK